MPPNLNIKQAGAVGALGPAGNPNSLATGGVPGAGGVEAGKQPPKKEKFIRNAVSQKFEEERGRDEERSRITQHNRDTMPQWNDEMKTMRERFLERWYANEDDVNYPNISIKDFYLLKTIGKGAYGRVMLCQHRISLSLGAMKIMHKKILQERKKAAAHLRNEKRILDAVEFPCLIKATFLFEDLANIYIVMEFASGGDLFTLMRDQGPFKESVAKFYACEVLLALEYLHNVNILHRDLKPENILVTNSGHVKMTDYGFACRLGPDERTYTILGTPEYMAPEILTGKGYNKSVDWWAFGILIYELCSKYTPFAKAGPGRVSKETLMRKIREEKPHPPNHVSKECQSLLRHLLERDVTRRLGLRKGGVEDIKLHEWFSDTDWYSVYQQKWPPPFFPIDHMEHEADTQFFDEQQEEKIPQTAAAAAAGAQAAAP